MPKEDSFVSFKNYQRQMTVPFIIYADFECYPKKMDTCQPDPERAYNKTYQMHQPPGFSYRIKYTQGDYKNLVVHFGKDAAKTFVKSIKREISEIAKFYESKILMVRTDKDKENFAASILCHICGNTLGFNKVRDHNHRTGTYRGAAHNECYLAFELHKFVPIVFHDLSGYDVNLLLKELRFVKER